MRGLTAIAIAIALLVLLATLSCGHAATSTDGMPVVRGDAMRGRDLVTQFECGRCHVVATVAPLSKEKQCTGCHADINAGQVTATLAQLSRWQSKVLELGDVPTLVATNRRLREDWIRDFLLHPHDLRPSLVPTMPRLPLSEQQAADLAAFLTDGPPRDETRWTPAPNELARGRELLDVKGCGLCHKMTGTAAIQGALLPTSVTLSPGDMVRAMRLAPDLRFTRERFRPWALVAWLLDPPGVKADTLMPKLDLSLDEAKSIATYLLTAPLGAQEIKLVPLQLPLLTRDVTYDEVATRVLRKTCWHCHGEPDFERGDGGPGNSGGFGFRGVGLNLSDYNSTFAGMFDARGIRVSVFAPEPGTPWTKMEPGPVFTPSPPSRLVAALLARQHEEAGETSPIRGMPLGLPALGAEEVQLVETWIAQGRKR
jgi:hypothetical protein